PQVHRLAPFFRTLRASLQDVAPPGADDPRIVLLSPGPWSETAFEHAYLAAHLGYPLVEGADLTVRDGRVWLRSLGRLERVDVILRRTDAWFCDPLELRADSHLDRLVIKPIARGVGPTAVFPWELSREGRDELRRRIEAHPAGWVGQETLELASAPTLTPTGLEARRTVLRAFAVARGDSYTAMPGGLTRVAGSNGISAAPGAPRISNQAGAISKDTWVL